MAYAEAEQKAWTVGLALGLDRGEQILDRLLLPALTAKQVGAVIMQPETARAVPRSQMALDLHKSPIKGSAIAYEAIRPDCDGFLDERTLVDRRHCRRVDGRDPDSPAISDCIGRPPRQGDRYGGRPSPKVDRDRRVAGAKINSANVISHGEFVPGFRGTGRTL